MKKGKRTISGIAALAAIICFMAGYPTDHVHDYSAEWSYNATHHWHECTSGDGGRSGSYQRHVLFNMRVRGFDV